ncbi:hypothetical protein ZOD2009_20193 [Haladaptatus paucihalophilus DX253]|uniref:Uncharacterized protein n=1 Tax=Haladaptatus paucihalophilus DX253 TaxID=797209 RepID=E7QYZ8_HALPU|nr:hypothetical protein [Haladaptatus paucihalophilus]EFW90414.1 hypothetical protein ZOD2009_20193 [Haladaptatus paucihalophilus DX253]SHK03926.1 hypothetical protein SAMN05444342_0362 [Haladaptatus paucihalophilus DX253]
MEFAPKVTVLAVILALVVAIIADEATHSVPLAMLVLLAVGFFLPLFVAGRLKRGGG